MMKKSRHHGTRVQMYEDNPERRIHCPEWTLLESIHKRIEEGAKANDISRSRFFERVMQNFFLVEKPVFMVSSKKTVSYIEKVKPLKKLTLHPAVVELIKEFSQKSNTSSSRYVTLAIEKYIGKYGYEVDLKKILQLV